MARHMDSNTAKLVALKRWKKKGQFPPSPEEKQERALNASLRAHRRWRKQKADQPKTGGTK